jgi:endonuclease G, mitochondrial
MPNGRKPRAIRDDAFKRLTDVLADIADNSGMESRQYFRDLMVRAKVSPKLRQAGAGGFTNNPGYNARHLVTWSEDVGVDPAHPEWALCGLLFNSLLESGELGVGAISLLASIIETHQLCLDNEQLTSFRRQYGIPLWGADGAGAPDVGPDFAWMGPSETLELQSFLKPRPLEFDFVFLERAVRRGRSVCRIEFDKRGRSGSGVFLGNGFVLTNHHVVFDAAGKESEAAVLQGECVVRFFGLGGSGGTSEVSGGLAAGGIVKWSSALDYTLLKLDKELAASSGLEAPPLVNRKLAAKEGTNLLHHPGGENLKISLSDAGIVTTLDTGFVQYITRSSPGSSGGPCFDDDWNLTAIHHGERSRPFGRVGEGILLSAIQPQIKEFLP